MFRSISYIAEPAFLFIYTAKNRKNFTIGVIFKEGLHKV